MDKDDKDRLAEFHHTVSEQLDSRLSESPKFFGLLIVIATGYGSVLASDTLSQNGELFALASAIALASILWAIWYLAALGYAFRFLQNVQHSVEHQLRWNPQFVPKAEDGRPTGSPPWPTKNLWDNFWLLPGIYHAHAAGLAVLLGILCGVFCAHGHQQQLHWRGWLVWAVSIAGFIVGLMWTRWINRHYLHRFVAKHREPRPAEVAMHEAAHAVMFEAMGESVERVSIETNSQFEGYTRLSGGENAKHSMAAGIPGALAGIAASVYLCGEPFERFFSGNFKTDRERLFSMFEQSASSTDDLREYEDNVLRCLDNWVRPWVEKHEPVIRRFAQILEQAGTLNGERLREAFPSAWKDVPRPNAEELKSDFIAFWKREPSSSDTEVTV